MSVKKFRFVSPGIFINEIDKSQLPRLPARMGPVIIGRSERGPGFRPTTVHSFAEFVEIFGNPIPGGEVDDAWRNGNYNGPTYGAYAAQAYLKNNNPVTFVRLLGAQHDQFSNEVANNFGDHGNAGWRTENVVGSGGGAYGLFVMKSGSLGEGASGTINVAQGTLFAAHATMAATAGDVITITDAAGLKVDYVISNTGAAGGQGSGTALTSGTTNNVNTGTTYTVSSGASKAVAVGLNCTADGDTQYQFLAALETAIEHANGHNGSITISDLPGAADASGQGMTLVSTSRGTSMAAAASGITLTIGSFTGGVVDDQAASIGTLAAVWYLENGYMWLSGTLRGTETGSTTPAPLAYSGSSVLLGNSSNLTWKAIIKDSSDNTVVESAFSFDPDSDNYIRRTFNTNPQLVNTAIYDQGTTNYWLGQSFERSVQDSLDGNTSVNTCWGVLLQLASGSDGEYSSNKKEHIPSETGWIVSQDTSAAALNFDVLNQQRAKRLFKFVSLDAGSEWNQNNIKISIEDIRPAVNNTNWATFTVTVRSISDTDKSQKILERFSNCNLNSSSPNYIGRKIGDKQVTYDKTNKLLKVGGNYDNKSRYVRVKTNEPVYARGLVPFGCYGPPRYKGFTFASGSALHAGATSPITSLANTFVTAGGSMDVKARAMRNDAVVLSPHFRGPALSAGEMWTGHHGDHPTSERLTASMEFPALATRASATDGAIVDQSKAYWGVDVTRRTADDIRYDPCVVDYLKTLPNQTTADTVDFHLTSQNAECQFVFTLDDLVEGSDNIVVYTSGSRQDSPGAAAVSKSITAKSGSSFLLTASTMGHDKFTTVLYGGFDGFDIKEKEPLNSARSLKTTATEKNSYGFFSVTKAIEIVKDPERVECNLMAIPGIVNNDLTTRLVRVAEERADTLAVIDIQKDFTPTGENTSTDMVNQGNVDEAVRDMKDRSVDSSYGAAYYPWVQIRDTRNNKILWAPPSVVALGAMAYSDAARDVWFAPAGFNRGGLTAAGAGGVPVVGINQQLTSKQRDKLYEVNVNPIASFPAEGIVIFGQKTLQLTPSALDRINVRRLLIFLKKEISRIASTTLFEPNLEVTWAAFRANADALLSSVKSRLGLADYKLVLDESTTTPELVDRNIMYAKVFLKPARAIEFIALDFIITRSGASFED